MSRRPVSTAVFEGFSLVSFTLFLFQTQAGIIGTKVLRRVATLQTALSSLRIEGGPNQRCVKSVEQGLGALDLGFHATRSRRRCGSLSNRGA
jgi:hypothetical protein